MENIENHNVAKGKFVVLFIAIVLIISTALVIHHKQNIAYNNSQVTTCQVINKEEKFTRTPTSKIERANISTTCGDMIIKQRFRFNEQPSEEMLNKIEVGENYNFKILGNGYFIINVSNKI